MTRGAKIAIGVVFALAAAMCGFALGAWLSGRFFVDSGSGLAGAATVFGTGLLGAVAGAVLAVIATVKLSGRVFVAVALSVIVVGAVLGVFLSMALYRSQAEQRAHLDEAYEKLNPFRLTLEHRSENPKSPFLRMDVDWGQRRYTATARGGGRVNCSAALSGEEAVALLTALREAEIVVSRTPKPCDGSPGAVEQHIVWTIPEALPPDTAGDVELTAACAAAHPALVKPFDVATGIFRKGDHKRVCE